VCIPRSEPFLFLRPSTHLLSFPFPFPFPPTFIQPSPTPPIKASTAMKLALPDNRYFFTLLVTALLAAKFLHLFSHLPTVPPFLFLLYLPTFLTLDIIVIASAWVLSFCTRKCAFVLW
jgi:hypothetical protein